MRPVRLTLILLLVLLVLNIVGFPMQAQEQAGPPLAAPGQHGVGERTITFVDASRGGRSLVTEIWYPGIVPEDKQTLLDPDGMGLRDAPPDTKGAPYPLILYSHSHLGNRTEAAFFTFHLASHGFVVAAMDHLGDTRPTDLVDRPLDILFVIDQLATLSKGDLVGVIDGNRVGVTGYSQGGTTTLMLTGARLDPAYFLEWCAAHPSAGLSIEEFCSSWNDVSAYRRQFHPALKEGELWAPYTDQRIRAALSWTGGFGPLFGERGLASATVPTLLIAGANDMFSPYERDAVFVNNHLGSTDRYLLSLVHSNHFFPDDPGLRPVLLHFSAAFFGYKLQGKQDYAQYLTAKYVDSLKSQMKLGLAWGPYQK